MTDQKPADDVAPKRETLKLSGYANGVKLPDDVAAHLMRMGAIAPAETKTIKSIRTETPILIWHNVGVDGIEKIERRPDQTVVWYDIYRKGRISESINATAVSRIFWDNPA